MPHMNIAFVIVNGGFVPGLSRCYNVGGFAPCACISYSCLLFVS